MAVSSLKGCWSKLSARIRDYIDLVDSYYRPTDEVDHPAGGTGESLTRHRPHRCGRKDCPVNSVVQLSPAHQSSGVKESHRTCSKHLSQSQQRNNHDQQDSTIERLSARIANHQKQHSRHSQVSSRNKQNCLSLGYTKRKTAQGQVYFVDLYGHKYWHDPSVPKELLNASLDLDLLVGRLSNNWEIKQTSSGRTYYINHTKKTTQFTDPRLVVYKDQLINYLKRSATYYEVVADPNTSSIVTNERIDGTTLQLISSNPRTQQQRQYNSNTLDTASRRSRPHPQLSDDRQDTVILQRSHNNNSNNSNNSPRRHNQSLDIPNDQSPFDDIDYATGNGLDNRRINQYQKNLLRGSHHDISDSIAAPGQSNTFTGPVSTWLKQSQLVSNRSRKQCVNNKPIRSTNDSTIVVSSPTNNLPVDNHHHPNNVSRTSNIAEPAFGATSTTTNNSRNTSHTNNCDFSPPTYEQHHSSFDSNYPSPYDENNNRELFDKISILRQELLKQQVLSHPCRIDINRKRIFEESFRNISQLQPRDLKKRLLVKFRGEEGLDYGGVAREWFYLLSREILNPIHGLFQYTSDDIYNLQINPDSGIVYREHLSYMNFCGRVIGMAVFHGHFIEGHFTLPFYKMLLGKPITLDDIEYVDPELHHSLCWILENDITDVIDTTFLVQHNAFGQLQEHELKDNGRNIVVTEDNKHEYVSLYVNYRCRRGIENQFEALQRGFYELVSPSLVENFNEREMELLIGGLSKIDIDDWRLHTRLKNCTVETPLVQWFWNIVKAYDEDKRARLLQFVTGSPRVPIQGFKALQGVNSELRLFTIHLIRNATTDNLPKSHTCFNRIDLPPYESYDKLRDKLTQAIEETMGFAMQ